MKMAPSRCLLLVYFYGKITFIFLDIYIYSIYIKYLVNASRMKNLIIANSFYVIRVFYLFAPFFIKGGRFNSSFFRFPFFLMYTGYSN